MRVWSIDVRSACLFRISLGILLITHAISHLRHYGDLYGPEGVLPSDILGISNEIPYFPSLLTFLEQYSWGYYAFIAFAAIVYSAFTLGVMTRLATVCSLCVFSTICHRNPYLVMGGDELIGSVLLWATLLPLGSRFSLDAQMVRHPTTTFDDGFLSSHLASFGLLLQISSLYFCTALLKSGESWWSNGSALELVLAMRTYRLQGAQLLESLPSSILSYLTFGVLLLEYVLPIWILSPVLQPLCRRMAIVGMALLHGGIAMTTDTGIFSLTMLSLVPLLISKDDWTWIESLTRQGGLLRNPDESNPENTSTRLRSRWQFELIAAFLLIGLIQENWNQTFAGSSRQISQRLIAMPWRFAAAPQRWRMFAPDPPKFDAHITVVVRFNDGSSRLAWDNQPDQQNNTSIAPKQPSFLWKLMMQRATLSLLEDRRSEGDAVRTAISQYFLNRVQHESRSCPNSSVNDSPSSIDCVEIKATLIPTESHRRISEHSRTVLVTRHEATWQMANERFLPERH